MESVTPARKVNAPSTSKAFYDLALKYCARRETSQSKIRDYLLQKAKSGSTSIDETQLALINQAIQDALNQLLRQKVIDDDRYAGILVRGYQRRGRGQRYINSKLKEKGLQSQINSLNLEPDNEFDRAVHVVDTLVVKGRFKKLKSPLELKQKLIQSLLRAGFDLTLAKKAVTLKVR